MASSHEVSVDVSPSSPLLQDFLKKWKPPKLESGFSSQVQAVVDETHLTKVQVQFIMDWHHHRHRKDISLKILLDQCDKYKSGQLVFPENIKSVGSGRYVPVARDGTPRNSNLSLGTSSNPARTFPDSRSCALDTGDGPPDSALDGHGGVRDPAWQRPVCPDNQQCDVINFQEPSWQIRERIFSKEYGDSESGQDVGCGKGEMVAAECPVGTAERARYFRYGQEM